MSYVGICRCEGYGLVFKQFRLEGGLEIREFWTALKSKVSFTGKLISGVMSSLNYRLHLKLKEPHIMKIQIITTTLTDCLSDRVSGKRESEIAQGCLVSSTDKDCKLQLHMVWYRLRFQP